MLGDFYNGNSHLCGPAVSSNQWVKTSIQFQNIKRYNSNILLLWWISVYRRQTHTGQYEGLSKSFRTESSTKYTLTFGITRWEATQRVMAAAKLTRLTHKIAIQLHLVTAVPYAVLAPGGQSWNFWMHPHTVSGQFVQTVFINTSHKSFRDVLSNCNRLKEDVVCSSWRSLDRILKYY